MAEAPFDIAIIGGGVNGCGIARDAAGRGARVILCEQNDLGSATSSASTKLIHGGLRYLEHYEFRLVREALTERERLWKIAPHIIWPMRFVLPYRKGLRPAWLLRLGLFLYDHIGGRKLLPATRTLDLSRDEAGRPLALKGGKGFEYSDCWVQDNRLVVLNARDAADRGAEIRVRTRCTAAVRDGAEWRLTLEGEDGRETVRARTLVNAAGPWVGEVLGAIPGVAPKGSVRLVQGSHIVVPKLYDHDRCYFFQNADKRIFFAIPYETDFTLIGTTDRDYRGPLGKVEASEEEIAYMIAAANGYFETPIARSDIVWTYSGVRPLYNDGSDEAQATTRDYTFELDRGTGDEAPLLSIFGGKITTYRELALDAVARLTPFVKALAGRGDWTADEALPGGDFPRDGAADLERELRAAHSFLGEAEARRLVRHYGTEARSFLRNSRTKNELGRTFGASLTEAEVGHLMDAEWARTAEDVVWRRTKSGLRMSAQEIRALDDHMAQRLQRAAPHHARHAVR